VDISVGNDYPFPDPFNVSPTSPTCHNKNAFRALKASTVIPNPPAIASSDSLKRINFPIFTTYN